MAVRKKKETEMDNFLAPCLHEEGHPAPKSTLASFCMRKKLSPLVQANSAQEYSDWSYLAGQA